ncbi:MAG: hypothetical protein KGI88_04480 [Betaproteobacteria bacterium]|uniref:hypothetical protein n=1 Tax=Ferrovum sp. PN-J185 TaxID=1356306 RepID=UPI000795D6AE|nr:hypothetical protein [Ferrovum sp. PN-J185]KXW56449.1 hypothetical protein FV185_03980 [Ferrovum sp. PN-J185]MDE2056473.1 hypothetical protein [Betaproteobacteria bacterium]
MFNDKSSDQISVIRLYRYLFISFVVFSVSLVGILLLDHNMLTIDLIIMVLSNVIYLYFLAQLATLSKKNSFYWIIAAIVFFPFGVAITFFRMRLICISNKWIS